MRLERCGKGLFLGKPALDARRVNSMAAKDGFVISSPRVGVQVNPIGGFDDSCLKFVLQRVNAPAAGLLTGFPSGSMGPSPLSEPVVSDRTASFCPDL